MRNVTSFAFFFTLLLSLNGLSNGDSTPIPVSNTTLREKYADQLKDLNLEEKRGRPSGGSRPFGPSYRPPSTPSWPSYPSPTWPGSFPSPSVTPPSSPSRPYPSYPYYRPPHYPHNRPGQPNQCGARCGDGVCEGIEDCITCPNDCAGEGRNTFCCGSDYTKCDDSRCNQGEYKCIVYTRCSSSVLSANKSLVNVMFSCGATMFLIFML